VSLTLDKAHTITTIYYSLLNDVSDELQLSFYFNGIQNESFERRIKQFLFSVKVLFPYLWNYELRIESMNSFPHSSGIASSASAFSALALCLCTMEDQLFGTLNDDSSFREKSSFISRLGSGSASRSIYAKAAWWGKYEDVDTSSDEYAISMADYIHPVYKDYHDTICIVSQGAKSVSSSKGHKLMDGHPYGEARMHQVMENCADMLYALKNGDQDLFGKILENEALSLHALMLSSDPGYTLMNGSSIELIQRIRNYRSLSGQHLYFTLDAGPNLHLLYPDRIAVDVQEFINQELTQFTSQIIYDRVGDGPVQYD
jgi:diphosphomevalonate decarboxylase